MVQQEIFQDGIRYILVKEAARGVDLVPDYISRMCREGDVRGIRHRGLWYVDTVSLGAFLKKKALEFDEHKKHQSQVAKEYRESFSDAPYDEAISPVADVTLPRFANQVSGLPVNAYRAHRSFRFTPLLLLLVVGSGIAFELFSIQGRSDKAFVRDSISLARANAAAVASLPIVDTVADGFYKLLCPYIALNGCTAPIFVLTTPQEPSIKPPVANMYVPLDPLPAEPITNLEPRTLPQQNFPAPVAEADVATHSVERIIEKTRIIETSGVSGAFVAMQLSALQEWFSQRFTAMENANATSFRSISQSSGTSGGSSSSGSTAASSITGTITNAISSALGTITDLTATTLTATNATTTTFAITSLPSCDLKTNADGTIYCGTDMTGGASFGESWSIIAGALTPTTTIRVALNQSSSTQESVLDGIFVGRTSTTTIFGSATSTFGAGIQTTALNVTSSSATSTFANGIALSGGCFSVSGNCLTGSPWATNGSSIYYATGNVGVGTTSPYAKLAVWGTGTNEGTLFELVNNASTTIAKFLDGGTGYFLGSIGIGTSTPFRKLSITDAVSTAQQSIAYDSTRFTDLLTDASGDFTINPSGNDALLTDDNLWVCTGGSCPTGEPAGTGNLIVESRLGVGTTTPDTKLTLETQDSTTNFLRVASTTNQNVLVVNANGRVGIGTSTPTQQLSIQNLLYVGAGGATGMGTATSTFQGDIRITGKLDVGTIDPPYTIDGVKYATYVPSMTGVKEETTAKFTLSQYDTSRKLYAYTIDFDSLEKNSDLWLFYQVTDFGIDWQHLVVSLTPAFDGHVFYEENIAENSLTIYSDTRGSVSTRLIADRFDASQWPNLRPDQDGDTEGTHVISSKLPGGIRQAAAAFSAWMR